VIIVNPDEKAASRIEAVAEPKIPCTWVPKRVQDWVEEDELTFPPSCPMWVIL
jgi:hypothetical protein